MVMLSFKELFKKYGKVVLGVYFLVLGVLVLVFYVVVKSNVDVELVFECFGMGVVKENEELVGDVNDFGEIKKSNSMVELVVFSGGVLVVVVLCNKVLFLVCVFIMIVFMFFILSFLVSCWVFKGGVWVVCFFSCDYVFVYIVMWLWIKEGNLGFIFCYFD